MKFSKTLGLLLVLAAALIVATPAAQAQTAHDTRHADQHAGQASAMGLHDPFAPVYIVTSRSTYQQSLQPIARNGVGRRDSAGRELVVAEVKAHQLPDLSHRIHAKELRCGGFLAFATRAQADAFIRDDRTAQAMRAQLVAYTIDNQATVGPWLTQVQQTRLYNTIDHLSDDYPNRYFASTHGKNAALWIRDTWLALAAGRNDVTAQLVNCGNCSTQPSVVLTIQGAELPNEIVVLGGHLDSISNSGSGDNMDAPGADDDASGIASLTEVLRIAMESGWKPRRTVKFMGYAAEETGLNGSNAIAQAYQDQGLNVVGMLQLDMTNWRVGGPDMRLITDFSNASVKQFLVDLFDEYLAPLGLTRGTLACGYACSDHASWTSAGYPSAMMFEGGTGFGNPAIHTPNDTLQNMGNTAANSVKFAKLGLAFLGELGKTAVPVPENMPPLANFNFVANGLSVNFTDASTDSDGTIVERTWNFGDGHISHATNPVHVFPASGSYSVKLTVTDNDGASSSKTRTVTVVEPNRLPTANFTHVVNGLTATFTDGSTDSDGTIVLRSWNFGDGSTSTTLNPSHAYATTGVYTVQLTVFDDEGASDSASSQVTVTGAQTQTYANGSNFAIPDKGMAQSTVSVSGRSGNAPVDALVSVVVLHPRRGDLMVDLFAPDGTLYRLKAASYRDSADNVVATYTLDLSSEPMNGAWKLRVQDIFNGDTGMIDAWSITF